jgi:hypothetical protein
MGVVEKQNALSGENCTAVVELLASHYNDQVTPVHNKGQYDLEYLRSTTDCTQTTFCFTSLLDPTLCHAD